MKKIELTTTDRSGGAGKSLRTICEPNVKSHNESTQSGAPGFTKGITYLELQFDK